MKDEVEVYNEKFDDLNKAYWGWDIDGLTDQYNAILEKDSNPSDENKKILTQIDAAIKLWNFKVKEVFDMYDRLVKKGKDNIPCPEHYFANKEHK